MNPEYFAANSLVWPLTVIFITLVVFKYFSDELRPILSATRDALAAQAAKNAKTCMVMAIIGASASMQALIDVAHTMGTLTMPISGWFYLEALARVIGPGLIAIIALLRPAPSSSQSSSTKPPFPTDSKP